jgi:hypothetical protein
MVPPVLAVGVTVMRVPSLCTSSRQHILRIYGHDAAKDMLISARELDCLKWIAAGKTAWEASVILSKLGAVSASLVAH